MKGIVITINSYRNISLGCQNLKTLLHSFNFHNSVVCMLCTNAHNTLSCTVKIFKYIISQMTDTFFPDMVNSAYTQKLVFVPSPQPDFHQLVGGLGMRLEFLYTPFLGNTYTQHLYF